MRTTPPHQGRRLLALLAERNRDQTWLAGELRVSRQQISKWTKARDWRPTTTYKIARAFQIAPFYFLRFDTEGERPVEKIRGGRHRYRPPQFNNRGNRILPQQKPAVNRRTRHDAAGDEPRTGTDR